MIKEEPIERKENDYYYPKYNRLFDEYEDEEDPKRYRLEREEEEEKVRYGRERTRLDKLSKDDWAYYVDNSFASRIFKQLKGLAILPQAPASPQLCPRCRNIDKSSRYLEFRRTVFYCELCNIFLQCLKSSSGSDGDLIRVYNDGANFKIDGNNRSILRICAFPGKWIYSVSFRRKKKELM